MADWTQFVLWFFIYSFIGWVYETILCSVMQRTFVNRGTLNGPYCPIYGSGALIVWVCLGQVDNILLLFVGSMLLTGVLEYVTSWVLEAHFHARWWDYSDQRFNINGRVFLGGALVFGAMSVLVVKVVQPLMAIFTSAIPAELRHTLAGLLLGVFVVDMGVSYLAHKGFADKLREAGGRIEEALAEYEAATGEEWSLRREFAQRREAREEREERAFMVKLAEIETHINQLKEREHPLALQQHISDIRSRLSRQERRNLRSFPKYRSTRYSDIVDAIRDNGESLE